MKKYNIDKGNALGLKVLEWFVDNSYEEVYLRNFGRKLDISPNSAQRFLNLFVREKFTREFKKGNLRYFKANLDSITFRQIKITFSLKKIENSGVIEHFKEKNVSNFLLFGSVANGLDDKNSDFDFVCIGPNKDITIHQFEKKLGRQVQIHFFTWAEWKKQAINNRAFYYDVIKDGISLIGEKPVINYND